MRRRSSSRRRCASGCRDWTPARAAWPSTRACLRLLFSPSLKRCAGNYSPVLVTQLAAKKEGFADVVRGRETQLLLPPLSPPEALCTGCAALTPPPSPSGSQVYLDAKTDTYLEEVSSCNIFVVKGSHIKTPPLQAR